MNGYIYKITNDINDKVYIGKTLLNIEKRFLQHKNDSRRIRLETRPLYRAMKKYGCEHFYVELVEECPIQELSNREVYWIDFYNSYKNGYNATMGGEGKQFYDYDIIVNEFLSGKTTKEIMNDLGCCIDTVRNALHLANIDINTNNYKKYQKNFVAKDKDKKIVQNFLTKREAAEWLIKNGYSKTNNIESISSVIGRVLNGRREKAYHFYWEYT